MTTSRHGPLRVGIGGPVGSGKTALVEALCKRMRERYEPAAITNDIHTQEDAAILTRTGALPPERIAGVETGGCPHTAIREDASINLAGRDPPRIGRRQLGRDLQPGARRLTIYVIDAAAGDKIPRKGGPGITRSDLLVINKIDLALLVGADLGAMERDARHMRAERPFVFTNIRAGAGVQEVVEFLCDAGGLPCPPALPHPTGSGHTCRVWSISTGRRGARPGARVGAARCAGGGLGWPIKGNHRGPERSGSADQVALPSRLSRRMKAKTIR